MASTVEAIEAAIARHPQTIQDIMDVCQAQQDFSQSLIASIATYHGGGSTESQRIANSAISRRNKFLSPNNGWSRNIC